MTYRSNAVTYLWRIVCCAVILFCTGCNEPASVHTEDLEDIRERGVLRVITLETAFSYYIDRDEKECGMDYDLSKNFADYLGVEHELILAENQEDLIEKLENGVGDIAAFRLRTARENKRRVAFVDRKDCSKMVLVQRREMGRLSDVTEMTGKKIWALNKSKYLRRLMQLDDELGGDIDVMAAADSLSMGELIWMVSKGEIDYCVSDDEFARLYSQKLGNIDFGMSVGYNQPRAWAVGRGADSLLVEVNRWFESIENSKFERRLKNKYIAHSAFLNSYNMIIPKGDVSPYDPVFKKYAPMIGWDWRILASVAWNESRFNVYALSSQGAEGLMQMMPRTAKKFGLEGDDIHDPDKSVAAGVKYFEFLDRKFDDVEDQEERIKFILAGYNAGPGHVRDAMALAEKYGDNPYKWNDHVENWMMKLREEKYHRDDVCKHGFFRAGHTIKYVDSVYEKYNEFVEMNQMEVELIKTKKKN